ncbi:hypothetical protein [Lacipirellula sp.]|uniref:hypothetical protein n=1 Tax=Lacipirellula sp. TaxID=2691419 RepID=UPI003D0D1DD6
MSVCINLPSALEAHLRREVVDLDQTAKEALLIDLYRRSTITHHELGLTLGLDRFQTEELLSKHAVVDDLPSLDTVMNQAARLEQLRAK